MRTPNCVSTGIAAAGICDRIDKITIDEASDTTLYDSPATERPAAPSETSVSEDEKPALVQVVPTELLLKPGAKQQFTARYGHSQFGFGASAVQDNLADITIKEAVA